MQTTQRALETAPAQNPACASLLRFLQEDRKFDSAPTIYVNGQALSRFDVLCVVALHEIQQGLEGVLHASDSAESRG